MSKLGFHINLVRSQLDWIAQNKPTVVKVLLPVDINWLREMR